MVVLTHNNICFHMPVAYDVHLKNNKFNSVYASPSFAQEKEIFEPVGIDKLKQEDLRYFFLHFLLELAGQPIIQI